MINTTYRAIILAALPLSLAACGGSSTGLASFSELETNGAALVERYKDVASTEVADMPTTGAASYSGVAEFDMSDEGDGGVLVLADVSVEADFENGTLSGDLENFKSDSVDDVAGEGVIANGRIEGNTFSADVSGQVSGAEDGERVTGNFLGKTTGAFLGDDAAGLQGDFDGNINFGGNDEIDLNGSFIAEQN